MKYRYLYSALFSACIAFTGCSDDVLDEQNTPWQEGDGIVFGARAGFENDQNDSRTIYTGETYKDEYGVKYERVEWLVGDKVSIYSPEAYVSGGGLFADYEVKSHKPGTSKPAAGKPINTVDYATLMPVKANNALQWGTAENHTFYACYPTQASTTAADGRSAIEISKIDGNPNGLHITGRVPVNQIPKSITSNKVGENTVYTAAPFMQNAHMVAVGNAQKSVGKSVDLSFKAICTALELEFTGGDSPTTLSSIRISSEKSKVAGLYECDLTTGKGYPACNNVNVAEAGNAIMVPLFSKGTKDLYGTTLNPGDKLKVTVFLLPTANFDDLTLTVVTPAGRKSHTLNTTSGTTTSNLTFEAHKKHYVKNIRIPKGYDFKNWMGNINDNVYVHQLSIPGSGSSFSNTYPDGQNDTKYYQTQKLPIADQWNNGIRCFEIISEKNSGSLGSEPVIGAKGAKLGITVEAAVNQILGLVHANPTEFAMIVMTYQPEETRNSAEYIKSFDTFLAKLDAASVVKYDPTEILGNVRNKIMFFLRPTSDGEDKLYATELSTHASKNYVLINGWGSLQDKWKQRGYPVGDSKPGDKLNGNYAYADWNASMEKHMTMKIIGESFFRPAYSKFTTLQTQLANKKDADYTYETNASIPVWAQEWNRVVPQDYTNFVERANWINSWVAWTPSYTEKLTDAKNTFVKACGSGASKSMLYFNCLTGYFIVKSDNNTFTPVNTNYNLLERAGSSHGDVIAFADKINTDFFSFLWDKWNARETGPLGVVMMNRIKCGNITTNPGNFYMPNVVISNNFSFPLETLKK